MMATVAALLWELAQWSEKTALGTMIRNSE